MVARMRRFLLASLMLVAGCTQPATPPRPQPAPTRALPPPPAPPPAGPDWRDWRATPGTWTYGRDSRGSRAMYGAAGTDAALVLRCDTGERRMYLSRSGAAAAPVTIRTTSTTRAIAVQPTGGVSPYVAAALAVTDPLLDAMAFSRGRFVVEQVGAPTLVLPAWAEIGRVIEDCR